MLCIPSVRDITILHAMGTATIDMFRKLEFSKERLRDKPILYKMALQSHSSGQSALECRSNDQTCVCVCTHVHVHVHACEPVPCVMV